MNKSAPHIQLRNNLLDDHVKAGWVDADVFLAYCLMLRHCDWNTGIWQGSSDALVGLSGGQWTPSVAKRILKRLCEGRYITSAHVRGHRGNYSILINNYIVPNNPKLSNAGKKLRPTKTQDWRKVQSEPKSKPAGEPHSEPKGESTSGKVSPKVSPLVGRNQDALPKSISRGESCGEFQFCGDREGQDRPKTKEGSVGSEGALTSFASCLNTPAQNPADELDQDDSVPDYWSQRLGRKLSQGEVFLAEELHLDLLPHDHDLTPEKVIALAEVAIDMQVTYRPNIQFDGSSFWSTGKGAYVEEGAAPIRALWHWNKTHRTGTKYEFLSVAQMNNAWFNGKRITKAKFEAHSLITCPDCPKPKYKSDGNNNAV
jgi:hypothetical protein